MSIIYLSRELYLIWNILYKSNQAVSAALLSANLSNSATKTSSCLLPVVVAAYSTSKLWQRSVASSRRIEFLCFLFEAACWMAVWTEMVPIKFSILLAK